MISRVSDDGFASGYSGTGVKLSTNCIIRNCTVTSCERNGIEVGDNCLVMNNTVGYCGIKAGITNGATIYVRFGSSLVDGNVCTKSDIGINLSGTNNTIIRNKISGNTTAIVGGVGNDVAPMSPATAAANPFSNFP